jgi:hypothetical protein
MQEVEASVPVRVRVWESVAIGPGNEWASRASIREPETSDREVMVEFDVSFFGSGCVRTGGTVSRKRAGPFPRKAVTEARRRLTVLGHLSPRAAGL